jgi:hypothetical protein
VPLVPLVEFGALQPPLFPPPPTVQSRDVTPCAFLTIRNLLVDFDIAVMV